MWLLADGPYGGLCDQLWFSERLVCQVLWPSPSRLSRGDRTFNFGGWTGKTTRPEYCNVLYCLLNLGSGGLRNALDYTNNPTERASQESIITWYSVGARFDSYTERTMWRSGIFLEVTTAAGGNRKYLPKFHAGLEQTLCQIRLFYLESADY